MKKLIISALFFGAISAHASTIEQDVMESLVIQASSITLTDADGTKLESDMQLPALIASALTRGYSNIPANKTGTLSSTSIECKNTTPKGRLGTSTYSCYIMIGDGDFTRSKNGLIGPEAESGISFTVKATRPVVPNAKTQITSKKVIAEFAG